MNKVICIESHHFCYDNEQLDKGIYIEFGEVLDSYIGEYNNKEYKGIIFNNNNYLIVDEVFDKYLIPLGKYREIRINKILNDV